MAASVLHQFLERRLLDIGDDDAKFGRLQQAAATLVGRLESDPSWAVPFALAAADPATPPEDHAFVAAHEAIVAAWPTYRNSKWQDAPTEVWRAVLLQALATRGADDADAAAAAALTLASVLPRLEPGSDRGVLVDVYGALRRVAEERAAADWGDAVPQPRPRVSKPKPAADAAKEAAKPPALDAERLRKLMIRASGPSAQDGTVPFNEPNPYWPSQPQNWSYEFAPRAAAAVADVVDTALQDVASRIAGAGEATQAQFAQWATATGDALRQAVADVARGAQGVQRRSALLWWRAALVSPTTGQSYRDLPPAAAAVQMAADLHAAVPPHAPESVEHFLREAVRDLLRDPRPALGGDGDGTRPGTPAPSEGAAADGASAGERPAGVLIAEVLRAVAGRVAGLPDAEPPRESRATLVEVASAAARAHAARATVDVDALAGRLGPAGSGAVALDEVAAWVFRDLQALRVAGAGEEAEAAA